MLTITGLSKSYGQLPVLDGINLHFGKGEIHGLVGENGAGKTTLFNCVAGMEQYEGKIEYDGGILKNQLGYLQTNPYFLSKMTGYEYLLLLCKARNVSSKNLRGYNIFDLPLDRYAETYSTGMQKKLAITGILLQKNDVFILDEPFNGVDISSNMMIQEILMKLRELKKIILMSSHIFSTLQDACDVLHYLKDGRIKYSLPKGQFDQIKNEMNTEGVTVRIIEDLYAR